jgi:chromosome segregation ATPase
MSEETGQAHDERDELTAELAEVRKKYQASQAQVRWQARLIGNLQQHSSKMTAELEETIAKKDDLQTQLSQWQVGHDATREQLARCKEEVDMFAAENAELQDTVRILQDKQVHGDIPGLLTAIQGAAEQARGLI